MSILLVIVIIGMFSTSAGTKNSLSGGNSGNAFASNDSVNFAVAQGTADVTSFTEEQRTQLMDALIFENYEDMSIAQFNRSVNAVLSEGDAVWILDDILCQSKEETPIISYLNSTVLPSWNEYNARMDEVYSGSTHDPEYMSSAGSLILADVYGDSVTVGSYLAYYGITYRILDQDQLTVGERNQFLQSIESAAQKVMAETASHSSQDAAENLEQLLTDALNDAGEAASSHKILFTGCSIYDMEVYPN